MDTLLQDLRTSVRLLWKHKALSLAAVVTLGLGIAGTTATFSIVNAIVLRPLPFAEPDRLVALHNSYPRAGVEIGSNSVPDYFDRRAQKQVFEEVAIFRTRGQTVGTAGHVERLTAMQTTPSLFPLLRVTPALGRAFTEEDAEEGHEQRVILSHALWQRLMGGTSDAIGKDLRLNEVPYAIVGVMPAGFQFWQADVDMWIPTAFSARDRSDESRHSNGYNMLARLAPGATLERAQQVIDALNVRNLDLVPAVKGLLIDAGYHTPVVPAQAFLVGEVSRSLYLLWGGSLLVLLIGCVNIANLALVRASGRMPEIATRYALGAGIGRLARLTVTESMLVAVTGGMLGLVLGAWTLDLVRRLGLERLPRAFEVRFDAPVVIYTLVLMALIGVVVGLVPLVGLRPRTLGLAIRDEGRSGTGSRRTRAVRRSLATVQVALALVLLAGSALLFESFQRVLAIDPGFRSEGVWTSAISPPASRYGDDASLVAFQRRLLEDVRALPGVASAGLTDMIPFGSGTSDSVIFAEGYQPKPGESVISAYQTSVTPGYFESMGVRLLRGRFFSEADTADSPRAIIIDDRIAERFWPGSNPIGRRMWRPSDPSLTPPADQSQYWTVVGVVNTVYVQSPTGSADRVGAVYYPMTQDTSRNIVLAVRSAIAPAALTPAIRQAVRRLDAELPIYNTRTMTERRDQALQSRRTPLVLAVIFGAIALFLAAVGLYGVLAYQVTQRRREIGIRMALGGQAGSIVRLVLREGLVMVGVGGVLGLVGVLAMGRVLESQLYGVRPGDPAIIAGMTAVVVGVALVACLVPARRAAKTDPVRALNDL